jgi:hypothetical protein
MRSLCVSAVPPPASLRVPARRGAAAGIGEGRVAIVSPIRCL